MKIGTVTVEPAVMNGACNIAKTIDDVKEYAKTSVGAITVGSITVQPRDGNAEPRWFVGDGYALNSFGMPNGGIEFYRENLPEMIHLAHDADKKLSLSIAGFSTDEYVQLASMAESAKVDLLELNLGCPNISVDGVQKPIVSFDREKMIEIINAVSAVTVIPLMVKLSPYSNPAELKLVADVLTKSNKVSAVVTSNSFPNSTMNVDGKPVIVAEYAGFTGHSFLPIGLGQVKQFRSILPESIQVIGAGGIETKADVELYKQVGASGVQATTLIVRDGHSAIERLF
ncbi:MAG: dihydroorotate oxidase [Candidatus Saccharibacteria bacterium]|nr:dihydroorotate oxidase [Candidatus Saccharibacteria bacterium]